MKERQLMKAEKKLEEDAMAFEEFLRENDQRSVDALKMFVFSLWPDRLFPSFFLLFSFSDHSPIQSKLTNFSFQCSARNYKQTPNDSRAEEGEYGDTVDEKVRPGTVFSSSSVLAPLKPTCAWQDLSGTNPDQLMTS